MDRCAATDYGWGTKNTTLLSFVLSGLFTQISLSGANAPRTEESAVTPIFASWHAKDNDRILADLKKRNGNVGLLLVGDSITALWPKQGPQELRPV